MSQNGSVTLTQVAVGVVYNAQGQVLFAQRPAGKPYAGWWEFPGGKIERNETLEHALARELKEELDINILDCHAWLTQGFIYPHASVNLHFCNVTQFTGKLKGLEGQAFCWGSVHTPPLPFLPAALPVLKMIQLPKQLYLSNVLDIGLSNWNTVISHIHRGVVLIQEPALSNSELRYVIEMAMLWQNGDQSNRKVLISSEHQSNLWGLTNGVWLSSEHLNTCTARPSCQWLGAQVTHEHELQLAKTLGCDFVTVHINQTPLNIKMNQPSQGPGLQQTLPTWGALQMLLENTPVCAYIQGLNSDLELPFAYAAGAVGRLSPLAINTTNSVLI